MPSPARRVTPRCDFVVRFMATRSQTSGSRLCSSSALITAFIRSCSRGKNPRPATSTGVQNACQRNATKNRPLRVAGRRNCPPCFPLCPFLIRHSIPSMYLLFFSSHFRRRYFHFFQFKHSKFELR